MEERAREKEKDRSAKAKAKVKVKTAEKERAKAKAKTAEKDMAGPLQLHHRPAGKEKTTACVTTAGSGAILARTAQYPIVERPLDLLRRRPKKRHRRS